MQILMVAAENDAIKGAKVGGVADVVRDVPTALAQLGHDVDVIIPDYGNYAQNYESNVIATFQVPFCGHHEEVVLAQLFIQSGAQKVRQFVLSHPLFTSGGIGRVYLDDPSDRPFASDATKYALFCAAVSEALQAKHLIRPDVLHLHDWHSALITILSEYSRRYESLKTIHMVYTVHNLALQGIRPFHNDESSLEHWFPSLSYDGQVICDPRYFHCLNPMRAAINLADKVHLVSPTYALEVLHTSEHENGFFGGEGLERDLKQAQEQNKLSGILNGCDYDDETVAPITLSALLNQSKQAVKAWMAQSSELKTVHYLASEQIKNWLKKSDFKGPLVTSIGRLTDQKVLLLRKKMNDTDVFSDLLQSLANAGGKMILLGSGDVQIEFEFMQLMAKHDNFLFLNGYDQALSEYLYHLGDLFLMPSSFEPCGISQMLALKAGQPCLVHSVGGLKDTVKHLENGFCFDGESITEQQYNLIHVLKVALDVFNNQEDKWCKLTKQAKEERFSWHRSANLYVSELYQHRK